MDGPLERSSTLGAGAAETRQQVRGQRRRGELPRAASEAAEVQSAVEDFDQRAGTAATWRAVPPEQRWSADNGGRIVPDPLHEAQAGGVVVDFLYLDDSDVLCDPRLVLPHPQCFDPANGAVGRERNRQKTGVIYYADAATVEAHAAEWQVAAVRELATVTTAAEPGLTLGVATGSQDAVEEQLQQKVKVAKAMQERIAVIQDVQTEHVLNRESLGVGRVNRILRVHGDELLRSGRTLRSCDDATRDEMDGLLPGMTTEGHEQATLAAAVGGLGWRRASERARPANL